MAAIIADRQNPTSFFPPNHPIGTFNIRRPHHGKTCRQPQPSLAVPPIMALRPNERCLMVGAKRASSDPLPRDGDLATG